MTELFIATPMYGGQCYGAYCDSMMKLAVLLTEHKIEFHFYPIFNESHIDRARNVCADAFLRCQSATHLLFVDSDLSFDPKHIIPLLASDKEVICGFYPKKKINWRRVADAVHSGFADDDPEDLQHVIADMVFTPAEGDNGNNRSIYELTPVHEAGTGFMLAKKSIFLKILNRFSNLSYYKNGPFSEVINCFFDAQIEDGRFLSEDYAFCSLVRRVGAKVYLAPWIKMIHHGYYQYIGDIEAVSAVIMEKQNVRVG